MQSQDVSKVRTISPNYPGSRELRSLLDPNYFLLPLLGSRFPLDTALGLNGRVWISAKEVKQTIAATRCIEAADPAGGGMDQIAIKKFIGTLDL